jgi:thiamine biosynthesis lipoprotein
MTVLTATEPLIRRRKPLLGTYVEIGAEQIGSKCAIDMAFAGIEIIHTLMSFHEPDSELSRLNRSYGMPLALHLHTRRVLILAREMTRASGHLFNCTVGGSLVRCGVLPDHAGHAELEYGTADDIEIDRETVRLRRPVLITLDGIAKGYAVDLAIRILKQHGVARGWVNAGGDMRVFGPSPLAVHRREADGRLVSMGRLRNAAMASSLAQTTWDSEWPGCVVGGREGSSPRQGVWTVVSPWTWRADALTKVAALASDEKRDDIVAGLGGWVVTPLESGRS